jgi:hypothetical protein
MWDEVRSGPCNLRDRQIERELAVSIRLAHNSERRIATPRLMLSRLPSSVVAFSFYYVPPPPYPLPPKGFNGTRNGRWARNS